jgi:gliding motility-associated-like protein
MDNDTPTNPNDDRIILFLNPTGNNLGNNYTVSLAEGSISPSVAIYGFANGFIIDPDDPTVPTYQITLTDQNNPNCTFVLTFDNPCFSACEVQQVDVLDVSCDDNGTPSQASDDYITMEINASGEALALQYNLVASSGLVLPGTGFYNTDEFFRLTPGSAGNGPVSFTLTDQQDLNCQFSFAIDDPGTCVSPCAISSPNLLGVQCDDMGTPNTPDDDELLITLNPTGISTGSAYTISSPGLNFENTIGTYNTPSTFRLNNAANIPASFSLVLTDNQNPACTAQVFINNTAPCSTPLPCDISNATPINISCNNGGVINFTIAPNSSSGTLYNMTIPNGTLLGQNFGTFGMPASFSFLPNTPQSSVYNITIRDTENNACTASFALNNPCDDCLLDAVNIIDIQCGDNGTNTFQGDDQMIITLQPTGINLASGYSVVANGQPAVPSGANYNSPATFVLPPGTANSSEVQITIIDNDNPSCTLSFSEPGPGSCSDACTIFDQGITSFECNNNGTISYPNDDFITFSLNVPAVSGASGYFITSDGPAVTPSSGLYNTSQSFYLPLGSAGNGGTTITLTDQNNPGCTLSFFLYDPGDCSAACNISATEVNLFCQDGGTPGIFDDDTYQVEIEVLNPTAASASTWLSDTPQGDTAGDYNDVASLGPFLISDGPIDITFSDEVSPNCTTTVNLIPPPACSDTCEIQSAGLTNLNCDNNILEFNLNPTGNAIDAIYEIQIDSALIIGSSTASYGVSTTFQFQPEIPLPEQYEVTITDNSVPECQFVIAIDDPCKNCDITDVNLVSTICDNAGTPSDPGDDFIDIELVVSSEYGTNYTLELASGNTLPGIGTYDSLSVFSMPPGSAGDGNVPLIVRDMSDLTCSQVFVISDPGSCSDECLLTQANPTDITCNDNGTPGDPTDDFASFNLLVNGLNTAGQYNLSYSNGTLTPQEGVYGTISAFSLPPGSTNANTISVTVIDNTSENCMASFNVPNPGSCSDSCSIEADLLNINCLNNGTPLDPTDDLFEFSVEVNNSFGTAGWLTIPPIGMQTGVYGTPETIGPFPISGGSINLAFLDENLTSCFSILSIAPPAACSDSCALEASIEVLPCEDNGTPGSTLDDFFTAELTVSGVNNGSGWEITSPLDTSGVYDSTYIIGPFPASIPSTLISVADIDSSFCNVDIEITSPGTCSAGCSSADSTFLYLESCNPLDTGISVEVLTNQLACDSFIITETTLLATDTIFLFAESCNPIDTGTVAQSLTNQFGCDSTVITTTTLLPSDTTLLFSESCNPMDTGTVAQSLTNQFGCDSTVITTTTLLPSDTTLMFSESCNPSDTGTVAQFLTNQFGCDSTIITTTTLLPEDSVFVNTISCNPVDTGTTIQVFSNQFGCDSVVTTLTTLATQYEITNTLFSCNPQDTGIVTQTFTSQLGCDSVVITQTLLSPSDSTLLFAESCNPSDTGTVALSLTNQFGCDSTVITTTTLLPSDTTLLFAESCNPSDTGTVALSLTNQFGCDSTVITTTTLLPGDTTLLFAESCNPLDTGSVALSLTNQFGCDSIVITTTTLLPSYQIPVVLDICAGDSILFNGSYYSEQQPAGIDTLNTVDGCDSILVVSINVLLEPEIRFLRDTLCTGETLGLYGTTYSAAQPTGQHTITSVENGCDSVIMNIELTFNTPVAELELSEPDCPESTGLWAIRRLSGGLPPYTYAIDGINFEVAEGLPLRGPILPGSYILVIRDGLGCETQQAFEIPAMPPLTLDLGGDIEVRQGDTVTLSPELNFTPDTLIWSPVDLLNCTDCLNPSLVPLNSTTVTLRALLDAGCAVEDEVLIQVDKRIPVFAPNVFSPNGDNNNDFFTLFAKSNQVMEINVLSIYDRWGNQVFEARSFPPNEESMGWDGTSRGQVLNSGVFVYMAEVRLSDGRILNLEGEVLLLR